MEATAKEMEEKFGPGSEFAKKMEALSKKMAGEVRPRVQIRQRDGRALGKEMEKEFGPGSEFAKKMEGLGKDIELEVEPGVDVGKQIEKMRFGARCRNRQETGRHCQRGALKARPKPKARNPG